jgi:hypothetical protein
MQLTNAFYQVFELDAVMMVAAGFKRALVPVYQYTRRLLNSF